MNNHKKKMIAPVLATVLVVVYYILYFTLILSFVNSWVKYALGVIPFVFAIVMIKVCVERIKEIKRGEEDDLGKY